MKGWRTIAWNVAFGLPPVLELAVWGDIVPKSWWPYYVVGVAIANLVLRSITTTPVGQAKR